MGVYRVWTDNRHLPITGSDSCIAAAPAALFVKVDSGPPVLDVRLLGRILRQISEEQAIELGQTLHHAEWQVTDDPAVVEQVGMHHPQCARCRASVDQTLAHLARERRPLLVGLLYWAG